MSDIDTIAFYCPEHDVLLKTNETNLTCEKGCEYPVRLGILRFVPSSNYSEAFGIQWKRYRKTQLDSYTGLPLSENRLRRCLGEELWETLEGKQVLELGCGAGRFTEILLKRGALVTAIDLSDAVEANQENCPQDEKHRISQADIMALPFKSQQFDVVLCLGVIQHTPSSEQAIAASYEQVKPNGWLVIDHYRPSLAYFSRTAPIFRFFLKRMPPEKSFAFTKKMTDLLLPLHKKVRNFRLAQTFLSRISPLVVYYHGLPLNDELQEEWALLDTHDSLTDYYKRFRTKRQITTELEKLGLTGIWCEYGGNGVEARGRRPA
jgi:SAM-dependent methyltransferase